jgi:hypothetical protein
VVVWEVVSRATEEQLEELSGLLRVCNLSHGESISI